MFAEYLLHDSGCSMVFELLRKEEEISHNELPTMKPAATRISTTSENRKTETVKEFGNVGRTVYCS